MNELKLEIVKNTVELAAIRQTLDAHYKALEQRVSDLDTAFTALQKNLKQLTDDIKDNKEDIRDLRHDYGRRIPKIIVRPRRQSR